MQYQKPSARWASASTGPPGLMSMGPTVNGLVNGRPQRSDVARLRGSEMAVADVIAVTKIMMSSSGEVRTCYGRGRLIWH